MACIQACGSAEAYECKNKVVVTEMCNHARKTAKKHCHEQGAVTAGHIENNLEECVHLLSKHDWSGHSKAPYPHNIASCHNGSFAHVSGCHGGKDEAAVVYKTNSTAFLLAWSVKDHHCGSNKVHVESGPVDHYNLINWCDIKNKLDASCDTSYTMNACDASEVFAKITHGSKAELVVNFGKC